MPAAPAPTTVEFRFPYKGQDSTAPRDRIIVAQAVELLNMRRLQTPYGSLSFDQSTAQAAGGVRPGLARWFPNSTSGINDADTGAVTFMATCRGLDGTNYLIYAKGTGSGTQFYKQTIGQGNTRSTIGSTTALSPVGGVVSWAERSGKLYLVGRNSGTYYACIVDPQAGTVTDWPEARGAATYKPWGSTGATAVAEYRNSLVIACDTAAGVYFSEVGNVGNFQPGLNPTSPVALNATATAGQVGDRVMHLVSVGDDLLLILCENSVWRITSDPRQGGVLRRVPTETGVATVLGSQGTYGVEYCFDGQGRLWFLGTGGNSLWVMEPAGVPVRMDRDRIRPYLQDRSSVTGHRLAYDPGSDTVRLYFYGIINGNHALVYDIRSDTLAPDRFAQADSVGAQYCLSLRNYKRADQAGPLVAVQGKVYYENRDRAYDEYVTGGGVASQQAVVSRVRFAPFEMDAGEVTSMAHELTGVGQKDTTAVTWYWLTAASAEEVVKLDTSAADRSGTFFSSAGGRDRAVSLRATGGAHQLVIEATANPNRMRLQSFRATFTPVSRRRV